MTIHRLILGCLAIGVTGMFSGTASAQVNQSNPTLNAKYGIWIGEFFPKVDSEILINGENIDNGPILGLESNAESISAGCAQALGDVLK